MSCFRTRTERSRCIWSSAVVAIFVTCSVFIYVSLQYNGKYGKNRTKVSRYTKAEKLTSEDCVSECSTKECVFYANTLQNNMNPAVDPCEDFYSFACGKFVDKYEKEDNISLTDIYTETYMLELKDLLDNLESDPETAVGKMKITYDSCMKYYLSEIEAIPTVLEFLKQIGIPDWPNLPSDFVFHEPDLATALGTLAAYKEYTFLKIDNVINGKQMFNATVRRSDTPFDLDKSIQQYFIKRIFRYFNIEDERANEIEEKFMEISKIFEPPLRSYSHLDCGFRNATDFYLDCLVTDDNDWRLLCGMLETFVEVANISDLISNRYVYFSTNRCSYIKGLLGEINNISHRYMADYLAITFLISHLNELNFYFRLTKHKELEKPKDFSLKVFLPHWRHCVDWTIKKMNTVLGHAYTQSLMPESVLSEVQNIILKLIQEVENIISRQTWLTDEEREFILNKINITTSLELQMKFYLNETRINNYYKKFHPLKENFLKNVLLFQRASLVDELQEGTEEQYLRDLEPFVINSYSKTEKNTLELGFGEIRFRHYLFNKTRLDDNLYLAKVVGHEMGHFLVCAFEDLPSKNDQTEAKYVERRSCFQNQISNFTYSDIKSMGLNVFQELPEKILEMFTEEQLLLPYSMDYGSKTLGENLPDSLSLLLTDRLIKKHLNSEPSSLISLPYSVKQLHYLLLNQEWCAQFSKERIAYYMKHHSHNLETHRSKSWMKNSNVFSDAFNCPEGSTMNPVSKCFWFEDE